jgi:hypothetical protein
MLAWAPLVSGSAQLITSEEVDYNPYRLENLFDTKSQYLQLRFSLGLLKDRFHLRSLHDIALDLQLPRHEQPLCVRLTADKLSKVFVR